MTVRKRKIIAAVVLLCLVTAAVLFWWRRGTPSPMLAQPPLPQSAPKTEPKTEQSTPAEIRNATAMASTEPPPPPTQKPSPELLRTFEKLNHNPIEFYGRAVDQFGEPVAGAEVRGTVLVNTGTHGGEMEVQTTTNAQGSFEFHGLKGQDLGIGIAKEGYEYHPRNTSFSYSYFEADQKRHIPDPKNPVVFPLWEKQGAERLIHYSTGMDIPADGSPVRIDLATGKVGGVQADFVITLKRTPLEMPSVTTGYAWIASIEVVGGGMIRAGERDYYNVAPETGYVSRFEYTQNEVEFAKLGAVKAEWRGLQKEDVFLTSAEGKRFARVRIAIYSYGRNTNDTIGSVELTVWLNPNGSRNLEFDPKKAITPKP